MGKCSDTCSVSLDNYTSDGYLPQDLGIGGGDYISFSYCLACGQLQGKFPLETAEIEKDISDQEVLEFFENHFVPGAIIHVNKTWGHQVLMSAKDLNNRFYDFVGRFLEENAVSFFNDINARKYPTAEKFVEMFRNNQVSLEDY